MLGLLLTSATEVAAFPPPLDSYVGEAQLTLGQVLLQRALQEPLNAVATLIFALALVHTFLAPRFVVLARRLAAGLGPDGVVNSGDERAGVDRHSFRVEMLHFLGEVEAVFGIWGLPLLLAITLAKGWHTAEAFIAHGVNFTEPVFVVVIMAVAGTRPVLTFAEHLIGLPARAAGGRPLAWWLSILCVGPLLGSFITEPGAMIICALLLSRRFYSLSPSRSLAYATLGLLFVNVSVGGTLTHFAAPPVLMVARKWGWDLQFVFLHFGWKAIVGILASTLLYAAFFRREFARLAALGATEPAQEVGVPDRRLPAWITVVHLAALGFTVLTAHTPALFIAGFLFFLAFVQATAPHQAPMNLRSPLMVGFFLAGLVVHGTLQQWWLAPVLGRLDALPLFIGATVLTSFNDNAAITYLASLVPGFTDTLKYAVMAGAVTGGGLTVIANAPNPGGQAVLARHFDDVIDPIGLFKGATIPTVIVALAFWRL